jgi:hypothetical protein
MTDNAKTVLADYKRLRTNGPGYEGQVTFGQFVKVYDALAASEARVEAEEKWIAEVREFLKSQVRRQTEDRTEAAELLAALAAAPNAPSDATDAASPRQGLEGGEE